MASGASEDIDGLLRPPPEPSSFIGSVVGHRYRIERLIGRGGMGAVFEAEHVELGTPVALKVLIAERGTREKDVERFMREARAAVQIGHPNIVRVFDLGRMDDGTPYMAMERLEGRDLDALLLEDGPRSLEDALAILEPIAWAIDAVHAEGLVHRDIKPANIFLAEAKDVVVPKLLDFGLAQLRDLADEERLTKTGLIVGTPHYLAPEVGTGGDPDERSDQYAFAVIAYELLSGEIPFDGTNATSIMVAKVHEDPPRLPGPWGEVDAVWQVLARALARPRSERFESCSAFVAALKEAARAPASPEVRRRNVVEAADDLVAAPRPAELREPSRAPSLDLEEEQLPERSRGPLVWALGLALVAGFAGLMVWSPWSGPSMDPAPSNAEAAAPVAADRTPTTEDRTPTTEDRTPTPTAENRAPTTEDRTPTPTAENRTPTAEGRTPPTAEDRTPTPTTEDRTPTPTAEDRAPPPSADAVPAMTEAPTLEAEPARSPERASDLTAQGQRALLRGQLAQAARLFREATYNDPRHGPAWRGLGIAHERMNHSPEARRAYQRYLRVAPGAGDAAAIRERMSAL